ncbi:MAG: ABC transporter ATP-binding protein [Clostridia bacterium]|nr:ABC transporter ATP-binding protein [Clostridia bacterium]
MIELKDVTKSYNGERVLKKISLTIRAGEFVSIMGASGSGKSTLLNTLGGFLPPDEGEVLWRGENVFTFNEKRKSLFRCKDMGFLFQSFRLISTLTAKENVFLPALLAGENMAQTQEYFNFLIKELKIDEVINKYPNQLSGGQQQRVALARALISHPAVVVLDEPTGALDSAMQETVMRLLYKINKEDATTVVQVTHSKEMAEYGSRIIYLKDGEICG